MGPQVFRQIWVFGSRLFTLASPITKYIFRAFSLAKGFTVAAFLTGITSWKLTRAAATPVDRGRSPAGPSRSPFEGAFYRAWSRYF